MSLFKSKKEKEIEQRMIVKRAVATINKQVQKLESQKTRYIELAKTAVQKGNKAQARLAINGLKIVLSQQKKAEMMRMNFELASQMRDLTGMTAEFLGGMSILSKEMSKTANDMNFVKVQKEFELAMGNMEQTMDSIDILMESSQDSYESVAVEEGIDDKEINDLINIQASGAESGIDKDIDAKLEEITKSLLKE